MLFTGTIASNIAYGNTSATREQIEAAARQANCEFVWGMPNGFDTESEFYVSTMLIITLYTATLMLMYGNYVTQLGGIV